MLPASRKLGLGQRRRDVLAELQPQKFPLSKKKLPQVLADDGGDTPSLAAAFDKLGLPDAERCAARFGGDTPYTPYAWQWHALRAGVAHTNLVYSAPASGGKTLVAETLLARALWRHDHKSRVALFVVPKRALADEKAAELARHFSGDGSYGWRVRVCHGEAEDARRARDPKAKRPPALIDDGHCDLAACTWESAAQFLQALLEKGGVELARKRIACVCVDEVHEMGTNRSATLESFLCKVACVGTPVVACTATASNLAALATWLGAGLYETVERPAAVAIHLALAPPKPRRMQAAEETVATRVWADGAGREGARLTVAADGSFVDVGDAVVDKLCLDRPPGPVMLFVVSRADARTAAVRLARRRPQEGDADKTARRNALAERLRSASPPDAAHAADLRACCRRGVLFHHAGLAAKEREMVEKAFARKDCDVLCCTTTLAVGVHLPVARVVIKGGGERRTGAELRQMIGRAGRAGFATEAPDAWIVCAGGGGERGASRAEALLGAAAPPIRSRLRDDADGLRRHVLEAVAGGLLARRGIMEAFGGALDAGPSLRWLAARGFLRSRGLDLSISIPYADTHNSHDSDTWETTPLGAATVGAGLGPADALEVAAALRCRFGVDYGGVAPEYALLHRLYLTAPLQQNVLGGLAHWVAFGAALNDAGEGARSVFKICGGCEAHVARRARGFGGATAESEALAAPGRPDRVCRRFALALLLHDRVGSSATPSFGAAFAARYREHAGPDVSLSRCEGGDVDNYARDAASLARRLEHFCLRLNWHETARACKSARGVLARGAPDELVRLMRASPGNITRARARALHDVGFDGAADLAEAEAADVTAAIYDASAFDPSAAFDDAAAARLAACIISDAAHAAAREAAMPVDDYLGDADDADDESAARDSDDDSATDPDLPEAEDDDYV